VAEKNSERSIEEIRIAERTRQLRQSRGLTLREVSERTGLSTALLSQIENGLVMPPIATLLKISKALGVRIAYFFQEESEGRVDYILTKKKERSRVFRPGAAYEYSYQHLVHGTRDRLMEPFLVTFTGRPFSDNQYHRHEGEEFLLLLKGKVEYMVGGEKLILEEGDSLYLDSSVSHQGRSIDGETALAIAVVASPAGS
jgi:transcriptional regulator with XRE-family HTH domain